jgi:hypothetical protein
LFNYAVDGKEVGFTHASNLLSSYLTNRQQYVDLDGTKSDVLKISTGVQQGSILGPLLFIIYVNDIAQLSSMFNMVMYADDTSLQYTLNNFNSNINADTNIIINYELNKISECLKANKLYVNVSTSKYIVLHKKNKKFGDTQIPIDNIDIEKLDKFNLPGLTIDKHLKWKAHSDKIYSKI